MGASLQGPRPARRLPAPACSCLTGRVPTMGRPLPQSRTSRQRGGLTSGPEAQFRVQGPRGAPAGQPPPHGAGPVPPRDRIPSANPLSASLSLCRLREEEALGVRFPRVHNDVGDTAPRDVGHKPLCWIRVCPSHTPRRAVARTRGTQLPTPERRASRGATAPGPAPQSPGPAQDLGRAPVSPMEKPRGIPRAVPHGWAPPDASRDRGPTPQGLQRGPHPTTPCFHAGDLREPPSSGASVSLPGSPGGGALLGNSSGTDSSRHHRRIWSFVPRASRAKNRNLKMSQKHMTSSGDGTVHTRPLLPCPPPRSLPASHAAPATVPLALRRPHAHSWAPRGDPTLTPRSPRATRHSVLQQMTVKTRAGHPPQGGDPRGRGLSRQATWGGGGTRCCLDGVPGSTRLQAGGQPPHTASLSIVRWGHQHPLPFVGLR